MIDQNFKINYKNMFKKKNKIFPFKISSKSVYRLQMKLIYS